MSATARLPLADGFTTVESSGSSFDPAIAIGTDGFPVISYQDSTHGDLIVFKCGNATCTSGATLIVDSTDNVGSGSSIAIGTDSFPVISYLDDTNNDLKVIKCGNALCSSANTITTVDSTGVIKDETSIAIGTDGFPVISYTEGINNVLKVAKCGNASCSSGNTITTVDSTDVVGQYNSIAIGTDGFPVISYYDGTNFDLKVAKCGNASCSSGNTITIVDSTDVVGPFNSIAVGTDGLPIISYRKGTGTDLKVAKCGNASCSSGNTITTVDSTNNVGEYTSIAIGTDGLPVIAYQYNEDKDTRIAKCGNASCSSGNTITTVDSTGDVGFRNSITVGTDGLPAISYQDNTNGSLKVAKCGNASCTSGNTITVADSPESVGLYTSIAIGTDGFPVISYHDDTNGNLKVAKCGNATCTVANTLSTIDSTGDVGEYTSIAIGTDGFPVVSYWDSTNNDLKVAHCGNATCTSGNTIFTVDSTDAGQYTSIAIGTDGFPVISYYDTINGDLKVAHCGNATCSSGNTLTAVDSTDQVGFYTSIAIGTDNLPVISYYDLTNNDLKVAHCGNASCSSGNALSTVDSTGTVGIFTSIAVGTDGLPAISYQDSTNGDIKVAKCGNASCSSGNTLSIADVGGGQYTSIAIGTNGFPVISYSGSLKVTHCGNATCSSGNTITTIDSTDATAWTSIAIGTDGSTFISYHDFTTSALKVHAILPTSVSLSGTVSASDMVTATAQTSCILPVSGDWTITSSCTMSSSATAPANVIVQNNSVLTIPNGVSLNIDFATNHLLVKSGSGVLIKAGGKIF